MPPAPAVPLAEASDPAGGLSDHVTLVLLEPVTSAVSAAEPPPSSALDVLLSETRTPARAGNAVKASVATKTDINKVKSKNRWLCTNTRYGSALKVSKLKIDERHRPVRKADQFQAKQAQCEGA